MRDQPHFDVVERHNRVLRSFVGAGMRGLIQSERPFGPKRSFSYERPTTSTMFAHYLGSTLDSGDMSVWPDSSGNGRDLIAAGTSANYDADAVNGEPGLSLSNAAQLDYIASFAAVAVESLTVFVVADWHTAANVILASLDPGVNSQAALSMETYTPATLVGWSNAGGYIEDTVTLVGPTLLQARVDASETAVRFDDDAEVVDPTPATFADVSRIWMTNRGTSVTWGSIAEMRVYSGDVDVAAVRSALNTTYALGLSS